MQDEQDVCTLVWGSTSTSNLLEPQYCRYSMVVLKHEFGVKDVFGEGSQATLNSGEETLHTLTFKNYTHLDISTIMWFEEVRCA